MSAFNLDESLDRARERMGFVSRISGRKPRSDRGVSRLDSRVLEWLARELSGQERPSISAMRERLAECCRSAGIRPPARATVYKLIDSLPTPKYRVDELPASVQSALYNLEPSSEVPGHQLAFYCFNHGDLQAVSFAAGLPWLAIHQALRLPGYRSTCRGLLEAVARTRRI